MSNPLKTKPAPAPKANWYDLAVDAIKGMEAEAAADMKQFYKDDGPARVQRMKAVLNDLHFRVCKLPQN